jgi:hypothetical protein
MALRQKVIPVEAVGPAKQSLHREPSERGGDRQMLERSCLMRGDFLDISIHLNRRMLASASLQSSLVDDPSTNNERQV